MNARLAKMSWRDWFQVRFLGRSDVWFNGKRYMRRWLFGSKDTWGIRLHCIERGDGDRELHDHPFWFVSLVLAGGYWEHTPDGARTWYGPGSIVMRSASALHRLELGTVSECQVIDCTSCNHKRAWTLVLRGRYLRAWGFLTSAEWKHWSRFVREHDGRAERAGKFAAPSSI